jgi:RNA polymerase sigma-70 factor (ECF subfamily)
MNEEERLRRRRREKERVLHKRLLAGHKRAFLRFYRQTYGRLLRWVEQRVREREDAEEIVHDTYLSFLDSLPLYRRESSLSTFLYSIARHEIADYWRKRYAKKMILTVPFADQVYSERLYSASALGVVIERVLARLSCEQAKILLLKYEEGRSVKEIARELGVSVKAAESRLFRARKAFQLAYAKVASTF